MGVENGERAWPCQLDQDTMAQGAAPRDIERFEIGQTAMRDIFADDNRRGL